VDGGRLPDSFSAFVAIDTDAVQVTFHLAMSAWKICRCLYAPGERLFFHGASEGALPTHRFAAPALKDGGGRCVLKEAPRMVERRR
jgi:hypothetical protein